MGVLQYSIYSFYTPKGSIKYLHRSSTANNTYTGYEPRVIGVNARSTRASDVVGYSKIGYRIIRAASLSI